MCADASRQLAAEDTDDFQSVNGTFAIFDAEGIPDAHVEPGQSRETRRLVGGCATTRTCLVRTPASHCGGLHHRRWGRGGSFRQALSDHEAESKLSQ